jgi:hypothetical protein
VLAVAEVWELPGEEECRALLKLAEPPGYSPIQAVSAAREGALEQRAVLGALKLPECRAFHVPVAHSGAMVAAGRSVRVKVLWERAVPVLAAMVSPAQLLCGGRESCRGKQELRAGQIRGRPMGDATAEIEGLAVLARPESLEPAQPELEQLGPSAPKPLRRYSPKTAPLAGLSDPAPALAASPESKAWLAEQKDVHPPGSADGAVAGEPPARSLPLPELLAYAPPQPVVVPVGPVTLTVAAPQVAAALAVKRSLVVARGFAEEIG